MPIDGGTVHQYGVIYGVDHSSQVHAIIAAGGRQGSRTVLQLDEALCSV